MKKEDKALWQALTAKVTPLKKRDISLPLPLHPADIKIPHHQVRPEPARAALGELKTSSTADIDAALLKRLRAGELPVDGRIDLHGMTQLESEAALARFIQHGYQNGRRCVLVITGRSGVLRQRVPQWLNSEELRPFLLAMAPARKHGGEGALYVLLKRRR